MKKNFYLILTSSLMASSVAGAMEKDFKGVNPEVGALKDSQIKGSEDLKQTDTDIFLDNAISTLESQIETLGWKLGTLAQGSNEEDEYSSEEDDHSLDAQNPGKTQIQALEKILSFKKSQLKFLREKESQCGQDANLDPKKLVQECQELLETKTLPPEEADTAYQELLNVMGHPTYISEVENLRNALQENEDARQLFVETNQNKDKQIQALNQSANIYIAFTDEKIGDLTQENSHLEQKLNQEQISSLQRHALFVSEIMEKLGKDEMDKILARIEDQMKHPITPEQAAGILNSLFSNS